MENDFFGNPFEEYLSSKEKLDDDEDSKDKKKSKKSKSNSPEKQKGEKDQTQKPEHDPTDTEEKSKKADKAKSSAEAEPAAEEASSEADSLDGVETLSEEELSEIAHQIIEGRSAELEGELQDAEEGSVREAEILNSALYLGSIEERINTDGTVSDELLEAAVDDVVKESTSDQAAEGGFAGRDTNIEDETAGSDSLESRPRAAAYDKAKEEPPTAILSEGEPPIDSGPVPISPVGSYGPGTGHGGGALPPKGPVSLGPSSPPEGFGTSSSSLEAAAPTGISNDGEVNMARRSRGADLLVGGLVGYLIGRRRGRIKTEKKMEPIVKSLEKDVRDLHEKITIHENKVRKLTREKIDREGEEARKKIIEKVEKRASRAEDKTLSTSAYEKPPADHGKLHESRTVEYLPESSRSIKSERLAGVAIAGIESAAVSSKKETSNSTTREAVNTMSDASVLEMAKQVSFEGQSAKSLYEQGKLGKEDLRRVVAEYLSGNANDAEKLIRQKLKPELSTETTHEDSPTHSASVAASKLAGISADIRAKQADPLAAKKLEGAKEDISAMADALIAQQSMIDRKDDKHTAVWVSLILLAAVMVVGLILF